MVLYGTIDSLIDFFSFTAWIFYGGAMLALIVMRYTKPNYPRPYKVCVHTCARILKKYECMYIVLKVPIIIPIVVLIISIYLIIGPIIDKPTIEYLYATMFILGGMIFYVPFVHYGLHLKFMGKTLSYYALVLNSSLLGYAQNTNTIINYKYNQSTTATVMMMMKDDGWLAHMCM